MNKLLSPNRVARLLGVSLSYVYRHFPSSSFGKGTIPESAVLALLNERRSNNAPELHELIPLLTERQVSRLVEIDGEPATVHRIRLLARRRLYPIPCFDLGASTVRFPRRAVEWWLSYLDSAVPVRARIYHYGAAPRAGGYRTHGQTAVRAARKEA